MSPRPTDHVVVVGAGLAGLSAAMHLAGAGRKVTLLERESAPGGRAARVVRPATGGGDYHLDTGPTVLTMPDLFADCFAAIGQELGDWVELLPLDPAYRARFADGSSLSLTSDPDAMTARIREFPGPSDADGYRRYVEFVSRLYRLQMREFIDRNFSSPLDLAGPSLAKLVAMRGFSRLAPTVARYFRDERLQKVFSFQAMYAGVSPQQALAIYAVISYMDLVEGVFYPVGGMNALPTAMAAAAERGRGRHLLRHRGQRGALAGQAGARGDRRRRPQLVPRRARAHPGHARGPRAARPALPPSRPDPLLPQLRGPVGRAADDLPRRGRTTPWSSAARGPRCSRTSSRAGSCATRRSSCPCPRRPTRAWPPRGAARRTSCSPPPT